MKLTLVPPSPAWRLTVLNRQFGDSSADYARAYATWKNAWFDVYRSIGKHYLAHSNAFTETDAATALFYGDECAALLLHKLVDFRREHWRDDSYFEPWPASALDALTRQGPRILICSHYTVDAAFRKGGRHELSFAVKDLIAGVSFRYFLSTDADAMTGNMRNAKGVQKSFYKWGAIPLMTDVPCNGETSDLVGVFRSHVNLAADPVLSPLVANLWANWNNQTDRKAA